MSQLGNDSVSLEGLMRFMILSLILLLSFNVFGKTENAEQIVGVYYLKNMFGHLHQTANPNSISLTTIACGHPIKVIKTERAQNQNWFLAEIGAHKGYVLEEQLSTKRPECFQGTYPNFFNGLNLDLAQMYYWGRLYDQFIEFEVKVQ